ncbi:MAG: hypothetical protein QOI59_1438, partial [Gammaproteobacteria bacterium]|nr:hypothetical protein [Gammaproteobacteria bacterium]
SFMAVSDFLLEHPTCPVAASRVISPDVGNLGLKNMCCDATSRCIRNFWGRDATIIEL